MNYCSNVWFIKNQTAHNLSLWLYEYFWIISLYGHLVYFFFKVLAWEICSMKWGFAKKVMIKLQRRFMNGSNFYESDVTWQNFGFKLNIFLYPFLSSCQYLCSISQESSRKFGIIQSRNHWKSMACSGSGLLSCRNTVNHRIIV